MSADVLLPACFGLAGTILGSLLSFFPNYIRECLKSKQEINAVTSAIVTEVKVTLFLIKKRGYLEGIETIIAELRAKKMPTATLQLRVPTDLFPIYRANLTRIGIVPSTIRDDIVRFYQLLDSAIADVRPGGYIAATECDEHPFVQLHEILGDAVCIGQRISAQHPETSPQTHAKNSRSRS